MKVIKTKIKTALYTVRIHCLSQMKLYLTDILF